ncbi:MurR/RpiR family transcriptional regulator [Cetobacterium sp. 8H]|uniref:MurR/RpiR family transcriptional regulator n=1 Tax=Cetobacterium sp. 8H TaxID=2759681 RepID=UPI00163CD569|nr:MurR/RpiR family transcriptional regulator [Cetobacterium sp. 8H]MBC2850145.1 MurR/RpiR family transcriptional regulator [Cetobacterium sp. 8H]
MEYRVINILQTRELKAKFTKSEENILDFIEKNFSEIPKYSVIKLCEDAYASQASVNRVCKKLGFKGFSELKYSIEQDLKKMEGSKNSNINNVFFYIENINFQDVQSVVVGLKNNRKILIYGLGASQITASYFQRQLLYLGFQAIIVGEERMIEQFSGFTLFILSSSGETLRVRHVAKSFKDKGETVVAITKFGSSLYELCTLSFTHNISIDKLDAISREQQLHMIIMVNELINRIQNG